MGKTKALTGVLIAVTTVAVAGCGGGGAATGDDAPAPTDPAAVVGEITVLTQRTDLVQDGTMEEYATEFNRIHPQVKVTFEGITDYEGEVRIRMNTENYGDVLMIPGNVAKNDYPKFFAPLGAAAELAESYRFTDKTEVNGKVYGMAQFGATNGFVYNKAVWRDAGIEEWPRTPEEFLAALQKIKDTTDATPYYTNFKDGWPLTQWTANVGSVTCDGKASDKLAGAVSPWKQDGELDVVDTLLHDIVAGGYAEKDPTSTNWEESKNLLAKGEIGAMMLGSWSITQMQNAAVAAGGLAADIGYMPFPAQKGGKFCATLVSDYQQAVNIHSEHKQAARAWIDWFTEESGYSEKEGTVPTSRSAPMPPVLKDFVDHDVTFVERSEARTGEVNAVDDAAEIGLNKPDYRRELIDIARGARKGSREGYLDGLGEKWAQAAGSAGL
ncbi:ABC transporter substrate-binding protein [Streptomyces sp. t39]|uniref:ABC transporter substrate-binding protein n=1 Tax=Streptomyces sp. t39 TaxID=1828156 RepID=UPI0011CD77C8|nr:ABC transporter substrate-binding protein [Streptomyces sp. t39]TXS48266.1 carbohydrate ABC transporter substrate-binding protein [Streptomyces sp. t39]